MKVSPQQREALELVASGRFYPTFVREQDGWHARWQALGADNVWVDALVRAAVVTRLSEDADEQRHATLHDAWMMALKSETGLVVWDEEACAAFAAKVAAWSARLDEDLSARAQLVFALKSVGETVESAHFELSCKVPKGHRGLVALGQAVTAWGVLRELRRRTPDSDELVMELTSAEAENFVRTGADALRKAGYGVTGDALETAVTVEAVFAEEAPAEKESVPELVVRVAGERVTAAEIRFLLDQGTSMVFFRDHWIEVDRALLKAALRALEKAIGKPVHTLSFAMGIGHVDGLEIATLRLHGWLRGLVNELKAQRAAAGETSAPKDVDALQIAGFAGALRPYQARGVAWLRFLTQHGFGALLADDMGLGKTVQTLAWMLATASSRQPGEPLLIVAPLTLLSNWSHECARFAPNLRVYLHQGDLRHIGSGFLQAARTADIVLTSYALLVREYSSFAEVRWSALVLDEAQTIKNPSTQVARAVKALMPRQRIALTGTPIENSVADVWSIEDFLNPGFLGDRKSFVERFVKPLAADADAQAGKRLRHALEPFVLRRLKSDPEIAAELGEKRQVKEYCLLATSQRRAYEAALEDFRVSSRHAGDIFALLTELKLICDGVGKLERLFELLEEIFACGESALVFTQYAKVGSWIAQELAKRFGQEIPFLHGGLSLRQREDAIAAFNSEGSNVFVLSLKAGGFGLNLTKATHVIHFDRWWNPAVENQATDRAYRIGQDKTVFVHMFITVGTIEEHVDELLTRKAELADSIITEAEWLEAVRLDEP